MEPQSFTRALAKPVTSAWRAFRAKPGPFVVVAAVLTVMCALLLSVWPSTTRSVRLALRTVNVKFQTHTGADLQHVIGVRSVVITKAVVEGRPALAGQQGKTEFFAKSEPMTISEMSIPAGWAVNLQASPNSDGVILTASPAPDRPDAAAISRVCVTPGDDMAPVFTTENGDVVTLHQDGRMICETTGSLTLDMQLVQPDVDLIGNIAVDKIAFERDVKYRGEDGREAMMSSSSIRSGELKIQSDRESPRELNSLDRLILEGLNGARMNSSFDKGELVVEFAGKAQKITNRSADVDVDLRPSVLAALNDDGTLKIIWAMLAFFIGLDLTARVRK